MRAAQIMPRAVLRDLQDVGRGIALARRRRRIPVSMMLERTGLSKRTYAQVEKGVPTVSMAAYAMALNALGLSRNLALLADPARDEAGLLIETENLPRRVRRTKSS
jgi:transcriptional regulator with XRE-family HTH domain